MYVTPPTMDIDLLANETSWFNETLVNSSRVDSGLTALQFVAGFAFACFILCTIFGNSLVICAVLRYRRLRHKTNYIILSLAVTDLTVAILVMPFSLIYDVTHAWYFGWVFCYFWRSCDVMCCTASILHLCCIALDRFWAIKDPLKYKKRMTKQKLAGMIAGTWTLSVAISFVPIYMGWFTNRPSELYIDNGLCDLEVNRIYAICSSVTSFFAPFLLTLLAYAYILRIASIQAERMKIQTGSMLMPHNGDKGGAMKKMVRERKAMHTLGTIMGVFLVSWLPFFVMYVTLPFCDTCDLSPTVISLITWLGYLNSALNPLIYAFLNGDFRRAFKDIISCGRLSRRPESFNNFSSKPKKPSNPTKQGSLNDERNAAPQCNMNRRLSTSLPALAPTKQMTTYSRNGIMDGVNEV